MTLPRPPSPLSQASHLRLVTVLEAGGSPPRAANDSLDPEHRDMATAIRMAGVICARDLDALEEFLKEPCGPYETIAESRANVANTITPCRSRSRC